MANIKLNLIEDVQQKFQGAVSELNALNPTFKHSTESVITLILEMVEYDEICEKVLLFQDRTLRRQLEELKDLRGKIKTRVSEDKK